jgi:hypothetical protein
MRRAPLESKLIELNYLHARPIVNLVIGYYHLWCNNCDRTLEDHRHVRNIYGDDFHYCFIDHSCGLMVAADGDGCYCMRGHVQAIEFTYRTSRAHVCEFSEEKMPHFLGHDEFYIHDFFSYRSQLSRYRVDNGRVRLGRMVKLPDKKTWLPTSMNYMVQTRSMTRKRKALEAGQ